jgi:D-glycero-D-manno-heptose 1,7-bisphosphate phosphatase
MVILDRDGVINRDSDAFIKSPDEFIALPGSLAAIAALSRAGFLVVIASNQSGVGRGLFTLGVLEEIHAKLQSEVEAAGGRIDAIFFCPHAPDAGCNCRKPLTGLFDQIADRYHRTLEGVPAIGDSLRDLQAARKAGAQPILVRTGNGARTETETASGVPVYDDLKAAAEAIIQGAHS